MGMGCSACKKVCSRDAQSGDALDALLKDVPTIEDDETSSGQATAAPPSPVSEQAAAAPPSPVDSAGQLLEDDIAADAMETEKRELAEKEAEVKAKKAAEATEADSVEAEKQELAKQNTEKQGLAKKEADAEKEAVVEKEAEKQDPAKKEADVKREPVVKKEAEVKAKKAAEATEADSVEAEKQELAKKDTEKQGLAKKEADAEKEAVVEKEAEKQELAKKAADAMEASSCDLGDLPLTRVLQFLQPKGCFTMAEVAARFRICLISQGKVIVPTFVSSKDSEVNPMKLLDRLALDHVQSLWFMATPDVLASLDATLQSGEHRLHSLQRFCAKGCQIGKAQLPLLKAIFASGQVTLFNLELNQLSDETVKLLVSELLINDQCLETLCIRNNKLKDEGAEALATLVHHPTLKFLNLKANSIGVDGACALAGFLEQNKTLHNLNLRAQTPKLPSAAGVALARSLSVNCTLRRLKLRRNRMNDEVADALVEPLTSGAARLSLVEVDLQHNILTAIGGETLARILLKNDVLEIVYVGGHRFGKADVRKRLQETLLDDRMKFEICPDV